MKNKKFSSKSFSKRSVICYFVVYFLFFISILRLIVISNTPYHNVDSLYNKYTLTVSNKRGTIYDCNMVPITNNQKKIIAAIMPSARSQKILKQELSLDDYAEITGKFKGDKPFLYELEKEIKCDDIACTEIYTTDAFPAIHILGYTDNNSEGLTGIQKAYENVLYSEKKIKFIYECDGKNEILKGIKPILENDTSVEASGVITTLDINIQNIAESTANNIESGAIIIADAKNGKIRACVSRPNFELGDISDYLKSDDSPLLNKAINQYNVGSVFKPCVAAAGIEKGNENFRYTCTGNHLIAERYFKCHNYAGHGEMNLCSAIANSCNTYFYNLAFNIGGNAILSMAQKLRFGVKLKLCDNLYTATGNLPEIGHLKNMANLANFSIGQGDLLLSPISMLTLYCSIANGGEYHIPSIVEGTIKNGEFNEYNIGHPTKAMNDNTAKLLKNHLISVLENGTGKLAQPKNKTAAGKTATAQTGVFENGVEICQGWFCGFFPAENPEYVVIIFSENTKKQSKTCAEIFSVIANAIN